MTSSTPGWLVSSIGEKKYLSEKHFNSNKIFRSKLKYNSKGVIDSITVKST